MEELKFEDLKLSNELKKAITDMGFEEPSPIQYRVIPSMIEGKDIVGQAQTGTGKTAAFGIPILEKIEAGNKKIQSLVMCPTRELAVQVTEELKKLAKYKKDINVLAIYGGQPIERQIQALKRGVQVVVGTPGRIIDHINRHTLKLENTKLVVLDEADEMLDMGFIEDIETILKQLPKERQTALFSATMPQDIMNLTVKYQRNPQIIKVVHKEMTVPNIEQIYYEVREKNKPEILARLIDMYNPRLSLVFCNTKRRVDELVPTLQARGYSAEGLHGDMRQTQRDRVMNGFRKGVIDILVATDVAARGIDVDDIEAVFNYDLPQDEEYYVHRIGRTARAGRAGRAFTFAMGKEVYKLRDIQKYTKTKISLHDVPTVSDIENIKMSSFFGKVKAAIEEGHLGKYRSMIEGLIDEDYASLDIASALLKLAVGVEDVGNIGNVGNYMAEEGTQNTGAPDGMVRLFVNIGRNQKVGAKDIVGAIANETGLPGKLIGSIDIFDNYTFVEVPRENAGEVLMIMKGNQIKGRKIDIQPANSKS